ncbi:MAG: hypothetical protein K2N14_00465 [Clostridia bacterium]|nr:hypothetical protein [Clostridia bacterium]
MSQISQLLLYQQKDSELLKLEQEIANSDERKKFAQAQSYMKKASDKLDKLEAQAQAIIARLDSLTQRYAELAETLKDFEHLDELMESGADLSFYQRNASQVSESLKTLKAEINSLIASAKETNEEYQGMKEKTIAVQKQYPELQAKYKQFKQSKQEQTDKITAELKNLAKDIDEEVLKKYQAKRSERIFPIICEIKMERCSKCGIELSIADKEKVAAGKVVECENCHRILYKA